MISTSYAARKHQVRQTASYFRGPHRLSRAVSASVAPLGVDRRPMGRSGRRRGRDPFLRRSRRTPSVRLIERFRAALVEPERAREGRHHRAEFETNLRRERHCEGMEAAKEAGVQKGRKPSFKPEDIARRWSIRERTARFSCAVGREGKWIFNTSQMRPSPSRGRAGKLRRFPPVGLISHWRTHIGSLPRYRRKVRSSNPPCSTSQLSDIA